MDAYLADANMTEYREKYEKLKSDVEQMLKVIFIILIVILITAMKCRWHKWLQFQL